MHPDAPYFVILLCLMPDAFTRQGESAATQWINTRSEFIELISMLYLLLLCSI